MSNEQKLKDVVNELHKAIKETDNKITKAVQQTQQARRDVEAQSSR